MAELLSAPFIQNIMKFSKKEDIVHYFIYDRLRFYQSQSLIGEDYYSRTIDRIHEIEALIGNRWSN